MGIKEIIRKASETAKGLGPSLPIKKSATPQEKPNKPMPSSSTSDLPTIGIDSLRQKEIKVVSTQEGGGPKGIKAKTIIGQVSGPNWEVTGVETSVRITTHKEETRTSIVLPKIEPGEPSDLNANAGPIGIKATRVTRVSKGATITSRAATGRNLIVKENLTLFKVETPPSSPLPSGVGFQESLDFERTREEQSGRIKVEVTVQPTPTKPAELTVAGPNQSGISATIGGSGKVAAEIEGSSRQTNAKTQLTAGLHFLDFPRRSPNNKVGVVGVLSSVSIGALDQQSNRAELEASIAVRGGKVKSVVAKGLDETAISLTPPKSQG